ncbi:trypsin-like peptidase domain-containing protein [Verrucomicrobiaceae bacterium N1E253]|uniref:Trypsin-like peptidase domain-containing protein n=1 Tax=Oceaniferula marina TaxID=2748318 RepID=A0A851GR62_9BACT|nr:trypsin-like peptidase domain-containing protein [Oceaniferula marina]NWK57477.1 trypsin-like peptidase domain-containing protein [Oceaniferula marina]
MHQSFSRFLILLAVFFAAFLGVILVRKAKNGDDLFHFLKNNDPVTASPNGDYTLRRDPAVDLNDVRVLAAINAESAALVRSVMPSVVSIDTAGVRHERRRDFWGRTWVQPRTVQGQGSGVIVSKEGHVLTNHHVITGNPRIRLTMHDGSVHSAKIIGSDPTVDIAVLKIESPGPFKALKFGNSEKTEVGNVVFAIGSPFGLGETVTDGRISAKKRSFSDSQVDLLQTSAAINPGNSGGPLVNIQGEIIGINSRIYSTDRKNPGFQGISFAVPSNAALVTMRHILARGRPVRGFLGMALENVDRSARKELKYDQPGGVRVMGVAPDAPALKAGIKKNDIITHFNKDTVGNTRELIRFIQQSKVGTEVTLMVWRDNAQESITATIGDAEKFNQQLLQNEGGNGIQKIDTKAILNAIGLIVRNPNSREQEQGIRGVFIEQILPESQLKGKLLTGDLIRAVNGRQVTDKNDFFQRLVVSLSVQNTELFIQRGKNSIRLTLSPMKQ